MKNKDKTVQGHNGFRILIAFAMQSLLQLSFSNLSAQTWSNSVISTNTADPVVIHIPASIANTVATPHLSIQRDLGFVAQANYVRQHYLDIFKYISAMPPQLGYSQPVLTLNDEGKLGLGYADATSPLQVYTPRTYNDKSFLFSTGLPNSTAAHRDLFYVNRLTEARYSKISRLKDMGIFFSDGGNKQPNVSIEHFADNGELTSTTSEDVWFNQDAGFVIAPQYQPANTTDFRGLRMDKDGNVGIGTFSTFGKKLAVNGIITCKEIDMDKTADAWPDYVFKPGYGLLTLEQLKTFVAKEQHLPGMPSATQVATEGMHLSETVIKLLEKQEELTLYLLQLNERIKTLEAENTKLKGK